MKNFRAPGPDNITCQILKKGGEMVATEMHKIILDIWDKESMPKVWKTGIIQAYPIYKKGDKLRCENYRGITLLNIAYKVFSNILLERLSKYTEQIIGEYQSGFRKGRGTVDQIFVVRQAIEKCYEHTTDLHILFVDFRQAFDSIERKRLIQYMTEKGIPKKTGKASRNDLTRYKSNRHG